jgi:hypothetical protein
VSETVSSRCSRGRGRRISRDTIVRLLAHASGRCQDPACGLDLWHLVEPDRYLRLAEIAHIIAAAEEGPRANPSATEDELTSEENLIVLCPTTHSMVDAAPDIYTNELLKNWKDAHIARVDELFGVVSYSTRSDARRALEPLLAENRAIWERYGPESSSASHPVSEAYPVWIRLATEKILPNNSKIARLLDANRHLFTEAERGLDLEFAMHADAFAARHLTEEFNPQAPRFPKSLDAVFREDFGHA